MNDNAAIEWTGMRLAAAREELERNAEWSLGRFLFAYARLESALDLCLVWIKKGRELDEWTRKIERLNFAGKLALLGARVSRKASAQSRDIHEDWLARA